MLTKRSNALLVTFLKVTMFIRNVLVRSMKETPEKQWPPFENGNSLPFHLRSLSAPKITTAPPLLAYPVPAYPLASFH